MDRAEARGWATVLVPTLATFFALFLVLSYARELGVELAILLLIPIIGGSAAYWSYSSIRDARSQRGHTTEGERHLPSSEQAVTPAGANSRIPAGYILATLLMGLLPVTLGVWWWADIVRTGVLGGTSQWLAVFFVGLGVPFIVIATWLWLRPPANFFGTAARVPPRG